MTAQKTEFKRLRSTPGMWIIFIVFLSMLVAVSIFFWNRLFNMLAEDSMPTRVFTIEDDVMSLKLPDNWEMSSSSTEKQTTFTSSNGYESLSISKTTATSLSSASIVYMLELRGMFPDASADSLAYTQTESNGRQMYVTQIMYGNRYYLCGVQQNGDLILRFVYSASIMTGEISDIDTIIASINYREGKNIYE